MIIFEERDISYIHTFGKGSSKRLQCFRKNIRCVCCGLVANRLRLERHANDRVATPPHWNMYYVDQGDQATLFTRDHIQPVSKGGKDELSNLQTMCVYCNSHKSNAILKDMMELRFIILFHRLPRECKRKYVVRARQRLQISDWHRAVHGCMQRVP